MVRSQQTVIIKKYCQRCLIIWDSFLFYFYFFNFYYISCHYIRVMLQIFHMCMSAYKKWGHFVLWSCIVNVSCSGCPCCFRFFKFSFFYFSLMSLQVCVFIQVSCKNINYIFNKRTDVLLILLPTPFRWCRPPSTAIQWLYLDVHLMLFPVSIRRSENIIFLWL